MSSFSRGFNNGFLFGMLSNIPMFGCFNSFRNPFAGFTPFFPSFSIFPSFNNVSYPMQSGGIDSFMPILPSLPNLSSIFNASNYTEIPAFTQGWDTFNSNSNVGFSNVWNNNLSWNNNFWNNNNNWNVTARQEQDKPDENISYDAEELKAKWSKKKAGLSNTFYNKVVNIAKEIKCNPNDLMALMYSESGLDPAERNKISNATGLIQFMPETAKQFGTSVDALKTMTAEKQLDYVAKYLKYWKTQAGYNKNESISRGTLYALAFLPAKSKQEELCSAGSKAYNQNKILDKNKDGKITKTDLSNILARYIA